MPLSAFEDRNIPPDEHALAATLGRVSALERRRHAAPDPKFLDSDSH
jgi:hypothetical protein